MEDFQQLVKMFGNQKNNQEDQNQVKNINNQNTLYYENQIQDLQKKIDELTKQINKIQESKKQKKQKIIERDQKINQLHAENQELQYKINQQQNEIRQLKSLLSNQGIGETQILDLNVDLLEESVKALLQKSFSKQDNYDLIDKCTRGKIALQKIHYIQINLEQYIKNIEDKIGNPSPLRSNLTDSESLNSAQTQKPFIKIAEISNPEQYLKNQNSLQQTQYSLIRFSDTQ